VPTLAGRRIVVTRRRGQASTLVRLLEARGATVLEVPAIEITAPEDLGPLDGALGSLERYDWVVFTSANAVGAVVSRLMVLGLPPQIGARGPRIASVGPSTTAAIRSSLPADTVALEPEADFRAAGLVEAFAGRSCRGARVLVPASSRAREELEAGLRAIGAEVDVVTAYATVEPKDLHERVGACLAEGFDIAAFASPSAVEAFAAAAGPRAHGLPAAVIGPTTEAAARSARLDVRATALPSTVEGLVAALERVFEGGRP
jgi:uroporphyrinogen III methyltransferase/synthase